jgi:NAD(P)-dependent dehydrogenase (short-subunit alcohol dehydrogenase family)
MKVVITYRRDSHRVAALASLKQYEDRVHAIRLDVSDREEMRRAAEETEGVFGKVHVLCNNAGVGIRTKVSEATHKDWDWALSVNVTGVANGIHYFLPKIRAHGEGGHIVATASMSGLAVPPVSGVYATTKFAVVGMMEALRGEVASQNIGVSVFCPGLVQTNLLESEDTRPQHFAEAGRTLDPEIRKHLQDNIMAHGMDAIEAGRFVLGGIRRNDLYILSHPEFASLIRARCHAIMQAIPPSDPVPELRIRAEAVTLTNPVYES